MSADRTDDKTPLAPADYERFHANAPAALARRAPRYMRDEALAGLQTAAFGLLPIAGLVWWDWSAEQMLVFMLAGLWIGIVCDAIKLFALQRQAEAFAAAKYDDWHVWVVADAIRSGSHKAIPSHLRAKWRPMAGVFVDFVMGGVSTAMILVALANSGAGLQAALARPGLRWGLAALAAIRMAATLGEIWHHRRRAGETATEADARQQARPVKVVVGLRGTGLFLLVFLTAALTEATTLDGRAAWIIMLIVNSLVVLLGLVNLTGPLWLRGETRWLREYLRQRQAKPPR